MKYLIFGFLFLSLGPSLSAKTKFVAYDRFSEKQNIVLGELDGDDIKIHSEVSHSAKGHFSFRSRFNQSGEVAVFKSSKDNFLAYNFKNFEWLGINIAEVDLQQLKPLRTQNRFEFEFSQDDRHLFIFHSRYGHLHGVEIWKVNSIEKKLTYFQYVSFPSDSEYFYFLGYSKKYNQYLFADVGTVDHENATMRGGAAFRSSPWHDVSLYSLNPDTAEFEVSEYFEDNYQLGGGDFDKEIYAEYRFHQGSKDTSNLVEEREVLNKRFLLGGHHPVYGPQASDEFDLTLY